MEQAAEIFEQHRRYLTGVAYRMLGSVTEAEDVVQDAYLRWHGADRAVVDDPRAYLTRTVVRLCLDQMKSARARREEYVGVWLPEPIVNTQVDPEMQTELADTVSMALLVALERLSPAERAAYLLHEVFDQDYGEIAKALDRSEAACRQLVSRAREHVQASRPRFSPNREQQQRLISAFFSAIRSGDVDAVKSLLTEDAVLLADGGGKVRAALNPIFGADRIARFFAGVATRYTAPPQATPAEINGEPGFVILSSDNVYTTLSFEFEGDRIKTVYSVRNPDKLQSLYRN
jgi:RNA polymerase sigma-70 factor, ECF subfamily